MNDFIDNIVDSVLYVKASGAISDVSQDLEAIPTKTIAQLLNEDPQEKQAQE